MARSRTTGRPRRSPPARQGAAPQGAAFLCPHRQGAYSERRTVVKTLRTRLRTRAGSGTSRTIAVSTANERSSMVLSTDVEPMARALLQSQGDARQAVYALVKEATAAPRFSSRPGDLIACAKAIVTVNERLVEESFAPAIALAP